MITPIILSITDLSSRSIQEIENLLQYDDLKKGDKFIEEGKWNEREYFLLEGICKSYLYNLEGEEITISFFTSNSILSPHTSRTHHKKSLINFKALTPIKIAYINAHDFENLMIANLEIRNFGNIVLRNELMRKVKKEIGLASLPAKERLIQFRKQFPLLENQIPHTDIASYLGITNISLSRLRKNIM